MITDALCAHVQHNCNIADAKHAGNFTLMYLPNEDARVLPMG